jgi:hypothetical protein
MTALLFGAEVKVRLMPWGIYEFDAAVDSAPVCGCDDRAIR